MVFAPLVEIIPSEAAVPALVLVGLLMMQQVIDRLERPGDRHPGVPHDRAHAHLLDHGGIGAGFVAYVLIKAVRGKAASVHPLMWLIAFLFVLYFAIDPIKTLLGV